MRILVHDYPGHPFQVQLSRQLAKMGHDVLHCYCGSLASTPQGSLTKRPEDAAGFDSMATDVGRIIDRQNYKALFFEDDPSHGRQIADAVDRFNPDVVLSSNGSPRVNSYIQDACWRAGIPFVCWVQDLYGHSAKTILPSKLGGLVGGVAAQLVERMEQKMLAKSDGIVVIADDFKPFIKNKKPGVTVTTIENWAPLEEMPVRDRVNHWGKEHGLDSTRNFIYSGTLGMKHNPDLLVGVAEAFRGVPDVRVVVISQGKGMDYLKAAKEEKGLENFILLPFQDFEVLPDVLASADVLMAILEPDAGVFSVPSKVLSYVCAGRGILLAVPLENLASRIVADNGAGRVVPPTDVDAFVATAKEMLDADVAAMGTNARAYAERTFDIESLGERFMEVFRKAGVRG